MITYFIGFIVGICFMKIYQIVKVHRIEKRYKHYTCVVRTPQQLENALKKIVKDMKENENDD